MDDYYVYEIPLPRSVRGCTRVNDDGTYTVYLNSEIPEEKRRAALRHELRHIELNHLYREIPVEQAEAEADGRILNPFAVKGYIPEFKSLEAFSDFVTKIGRHTSSEGGF